MKAKLKEDYIGLTNGKIYDVKPYIDDDGDIDDELFALVNDDGEKTGVYKYRFEVQPDDLTEQIKEAEEHLADLKQQLEEQNTPKVGNKYSHSCGLKYVLSSTEDKFLLVCYEGMDTGQTYGIPRKIIHDVFYGNNSFFTLISE